MCFVQPKRTWNRSASEKHQPLARATAGGRTRRRAGHLPAESLRCSPEHAAAGIYFTMVIICDLNGAAARRPQSRGHSRPLLPAVTPALLSCSTDARWTPFKLSYESLNSYYGGKDHDNGLDASHGDGNAMSESETGTNAAENLDDQTREGARRLKSLQ